MVQQVKDPVLSLQQLGSLLWHGFDPWRWNFGLSFVFHGTEGGREGARKEGKKRENWVVEEA